MIILQLFKGKVSAGVIFRSSIIYNWMHILSLTFISFVHIKACMNNLLHSNASVTEKQNNVHTSVPESTADMRW